MGFNIFQVQLELEDAGWGLMSDNYVNMSTPITVMCPKGHEQELTFGNWRKKKLCEICLAGDTSKAKRGKIPPKSIEVDRRVLALDAATGTTGYAIYDDGDLVNFGVHKTASNCHDVTERINDVKYWLLDVIQVAKPDFIAIENIFLQTFGNANSNSPQVETYRKLANLQGVLCDTAYENGIEFELITPTAWRSLCGVKGTGREGKKKAAQEKVFNWYGIECSEDEADAICVGKYAANYIAPLQEGKWT